MGVISDKPAAVMYGRGKTWENRDFFKSLMKCFVSCLTFLSLLKLHFNFKSLELALR